MKKKILLVDDMKNIVMTFKFGLEQYGYEVDTAGSGEEGYQKALATKPDIIIIDNKMPGKLSGWDAAAKIRENEETSNIPIIGFTAYTGKKEIEQGKKIGLTEVLLKPVYLDDMVDIIIKYTES